MSDSPANDASRMSMLELFRMETENQCSALTEGLLAIELHPQDPDRLAALMRAAHSLKGAARILGLSDPARVAHAMENGFVNAQKGEIRLQHDHVDLLLKGVDYLQRVARLSENELMAWDDGRQAETNALIEALNHLRTVGEAPGKSLVSEGRVIRGPEVENIEPHRQLRVKTEHWNRVLALAGDTVVAARQLRRIVEELQRLKKRQGFLVKTLEELHA
ncbi:MAG TPA: Hpt domain-containing protein, partial [Verrucomicrobiota bacterium]|nr:Hpt domain-containing protein [Verrucomicrobiota bacterium]